MSGDRPAATRAASSAGAAQPAKRKINVAESKARIPLPPRVADLPTLLPVKGAPTSRRRRGRAVDAATVATMPAVDRRPAAKPKDLLSVCFPVLLRVTFSDARSGLFGESGKMSRNTRPVIAPVKNLRKNVGWAPDFIGVCRGDGCVSGIPSRRRNGAQRPIRPEPPPGARRAASARRGQAPRSASIAARRRVAG